MFISAPFAHSLSFAALFTFTISWGEMKYTTHATQFHDDTHTHTHTHTHTQGEGGREGGRMHTHVSKVIFGKAAWINS